MKYISKHATIISSVILLLLLGSLAYLLQLRGWGFYKDDWHIIWTGHTFGTQGIIQLFLIDRPFMGVLYAISYRILGENPLYWQLFGFAVRMLSMFAFWWLVKMLWPRHNRLTLLIAAIFILYPGFLQQPNANTFQNHFIGFTAAIVSIALSVWSLRVQKPAVKIILVAVSIGLAVFYWMIYEYMIGLELVRFILLDMMRNRQVPLNLRKRLVRVFLSSIPYLLAMGAFLVWRFVIFNSTRAATNPGIIGSMYLNQPLTMLLRLILETGKDIFVTILSAWFVPLYQATENLDFPSMLFATIVGFLGLFAWVIVSKSNFAKDNNNPEETRHSALWLFGFGTLLAFVTLIPIILVNRDVHFSDQFDRYTLQATIGVAIAVGGLLDGIQRTALRRWICGTVLAIALVTHIGNGIYYQRFWNTQQQLWWQLAWRAPGIKPDTTLVALLPAGYRLAEGYEIWGPANRIYYPDQKEILISGETLNQETLNQMLGQQSYGRTFRNLEYMVEFKNSLILSLPGNGSCLHILDGEMPELSGNEDATTHLIAPFSRPDLIAVDEPQAIPPESIFGKEPAHDWCYYYQKISLARQQGDWETAAQLAEEALSLNLAPLDSSEWMPLYESYFHIRNMDRYNELGAYLRASPEFILPYCAQFTPTHLEEFSKSEGQLPMVQNICPDLVVP